MVIILNGPAGCGKDTLAATLTEDHGFYHTSFKHDIYKEVAKYYGVTLDEVVARNEDRKQKESVWIGGKTVREMLIHVSEDVCKPRHGRDYFGRLAARRCRDLAPGCNIVFSDGGFEEEVACIPHAIVVRLNRHGYTFAGDSRAYLYPPLSGDVLLLGGEVDRGVRDVLAVAGALSK